MQASDRSDKKRRLRQRFLAARQAMPPWEYRQRNLQLARRLHDHFETERPQHILAFCPFRQEPDPGLLDSNLVGDFGIYLPVIDPITSTMNFYPWQAGDPLQSNRFGILEPLLRQTPISTAQLSTAAILLPVLAVTRSGIRLGYGGGYYDRFLAENPIQPRIAVAHAPSVVDHLPCESHDQPVDWILTDLGSLKVEPR